MQENNCDVCFIFCHSLGYIYYPIFLGEYMWLIALILFGFIVIYSLVIVTLAFADDFFRKNGSR
ncbi:hypothetical protein DOQ87_21835 [Salmonella enterica subsp. enterica serovar Benin]|nr:hypothetical protein [Salmonella enterica subsp. enterica serovar Benin]EBW4218694.1 hypothetical protein [Salmonella enterica subsp. enterica serovar Benin]ECE9227743.1 hypothetical protein [Salmonella enterica subsp. enterica serovar Benin]OZU09888.1 hypothetical protein CCO48_25170 [Salmonella enterica subsp. enterica serovar Altendorf]